MSEGRKSTQSVPKDSERKGAADGVNTQARRDATGGASDAAPYPNPHTGKSEDERADFADGPLSHGGQSSLGYHGAGRLGKRKTSREGNPNSASGKGV